MQIKAKHILLGLAFIGLTFLGVKLLPQKEILITEDDFVKEEEVVEKKIYVHVDGAILNPGIKEISEGTRLFELIELSGGELEDADLSRLNLSSILKDEQKIVIPYKVEEVIQETNNIVSKSNVVSINNSTFPININYASLLELQKLSGIGPAMATKIINYRDENGLFNSIEDIKNVSGIGEAKFNKIKDDITI